MQHIFPAAPKPTGGLDSFIGPGATTTEVIVQFGAALAIGLCCLWSFHEQQKQLLYHDDNNNNNKHETTSTTTGTLALVFFLGIDMAGGIVTNATNAAKRWYHRAGQGFVEHMTFIAIHAFQIACVAYWFVVDETTSEKLKYFGMVYGALLVCSAIVLMVPLYLQRPVSMCLVALIIPLTTMNTGGVLLPKTQPGVEWFLPMLFIKLLVSHLICEMPIGAGDTMEYSKEDGKTK